jgi:large repetitive protein
MQRRSGFWSPERGRSWAALVIAVAVVMTALLRGAEVASAISTFCWGNVPDTGGCSVTANFTVAETVGSIVLTVRRGSVAEDDNALLTFANGTALHGTDYDPVGFPTLSLPFGSGVGGSGTPDTVRSTTVSISHNFAAESNRTFTVTLSGDAVTGPATATITILDVDGPQIPTVTNVSPPIGPTGGGNTVTISGLGFHATSCPNGVYFGATLASSCVVDSTTQIRATAPAQAAGTVRVMVINPTGSSVDNGTADDYQYFSGPIVYSISPNNGPSGGGNSVVINGTGFGLTPTIQFGSQVTGTPATTSNTQIVVPAPAGTAGTTVSVRVTASLVISPDTSADDYSYTSGNGGGGGGPVNPIAIVPASGPPSGGQAAVISGSGLLGTTKVIFGNVQATLGAVTATSITVTTPSSNPPGTTGPVSVTIENPNGNVTKTNFYTYTNGPTVSALNPSSIGLNATAQITITGTGFMNAQTSVDFGGVNIPSSAVNFLSSTQLIVQAPASATAKIVSVRVTTTNGLSPDTPNDDFTYGTGLPAITSITPVSGPKAGGNTVTVHGLNFIAVTGVTFGGTAGTSVNVINANQLSVIAPANSAGGTVSIRVTTSLTTTPDTPNDDYTYSTAPVITAVSPTSAPTGSSTLIDITGANFEGATGVKFGDKVAVFNVISSTLIRAVTPATATAGTFDVVVTGPGGVSPTGAQTKFQFVGNASLPAVTNLSPASTPVNMSGTVVTISGQNFTSPVTVTFGGVVGTNPVVVSATTVTVVAPSRAAPGTVDVLVATGAGTSSGAGTANDFTYTSGSTATYSLFFRWSLVVWTGRANLPVSQALSGQENPDNPATNNISAQVTAIFKWSTNGIGCPGNVTQCWLAYFPGGVGIPGANDISTLENGTPYWIAVAGPGTQTWTVIQGP